MAASKSRVAYLALPSAQVLLNAASSSSSRRRAPWLSPRATPASGASASTGARREATRAARRGRRGAIEDDLTAFRTAASPLSRESRDARCAPWRIGPGALRQDARARGDGHRAGGAATTTRWTTRAVNARFCDDLLAVAPAPMRACSTWARAPALIPIQLCARVARGARGRHRPRGAHARPGRGERGARRRRWAHPARARRREGRAVSDRSFDVVMSNSIVASLPEPASVLGEMWRLAGPGGLLFVRDLARPPDAADVERLADLYAPLSGGERGRARRRAGRGARPAAGALRRVAPRGAHARRGARGGRAARGPGDAVSLDERPALDPRARAPMSAALPFPWASLAALRPADVEATRRANRWVAARVRLGPFARALEELLGAEVIGARGARGAWRTAGRRGRRGRPRVGRRRRGARPPRRRGRARRGGGRARAAAAARVGREAGGPAGTRVGRRRRGGRRGRSAEGTRPGRPARRRGRRGRGAGRQGNARPRGRRRRGARGRRRGGAFRARLHVPGGGTAEDGWSAARLGAMGAVPLSLPVVACAAASSVAEVASLARGDVWIPGAWALEAPRSEGDGPRGTVRLAAPSAVTGIAERSSSPSASCYPAKAMRFARWRRG